MDCVFGNSQILTVGAGARCDLAGSNSVYMIMGSGTVIISSGATIDLTGNTNATPIAPGGGVVIGENVQIYPSAGSASAVEISGGTFASIGNGGLLTLNDPLPNGFSISGGSITTTETVFALVNGATVALTDCSFVDKPYFLCNANTTGTTVISGTVKTNTGFSRSGINPTAILTLSDGCTLDFTGATPPASGYLIVATRVNIGTGCHVKLVDGTDVLLNGGTATACINIKADGTLEGTPT